MRQNSYGRARTGSVSGYDNYDDDLGMTGANFNAPLSNMAPRFSQPIDDKADQLKSGGNLLQQPSPRKNVVTSRLDSPQQTDRSYKKPGRSYKHIANQPATAGQSMENMPMNNRTQDTDRNNYMKPPVSSLHQEQQQLKNAMLGVAPLQTKAVPVTQFNLETPNGTYHNPMNFAQQSLQNWQNNLTPRNPQPQGQPVQQLKISKNTYRSQERPGQLSGRASAEPGKNQHLVVGQRVQTQQGSRPLSGRKTSAQRATETPELGVRAKNNQKTAEKGGLPEANDSFNSKKLPPRPQATAQSVGQSLTDIQTKKPIKLGRFQSPHQEIITQARELMLDMREVGQSPKRPDALQGKRLPSLDVSPSPTPNLLEEEHVSPTRRGLHHLNTLISQNHKRVNHSQDRVGMAKGSDQRLDLLNFKQGARIRNASKASANSAADQTQTQKDVVREVLQERPFDFGNIKIVIKKGPDTVLEEVFLNRAWTQENIPHFRPVIEGVNKAEGIEITLNCNLEAFKFCIEFLKCDDDDEKINALIQEKVTIANVLNVMVTCDFLKLRQVYTYVFNEFFKPNFVAIISECKLNLNNLSAHIMQDMATFATIQQVKQVKDRKDQFVNNLIKHMIDQMLLNVVLYKCDNCQQIMTEVQLEVTQCMHTENVPHFLAADGRTRWNHVVTTEPLNKEQIIKFLRDEKRICWPEIYMKLHATLQPPLWCQNCHQWYCLNKSAGCRIHMQRSKHDVLTGNRIHKCCETELELQIHQPQGCLFNFHEPEMPKDQELAKIHDFYVPKKYLIIRDENYQEINAGDYYEKPVSLHGMTRVSEFKTVSSQPRKVNAIEDPMDDFMFGVWEQAHQEFRFNTKKKKQVRSTSQQKRHISPPKLFNRNSIYCSQERVPTAKTTNDLTISNTEDNLTKNDSQTPIIQLENLAPTPTTNQSTDRNHTQNSARGGTSSSTRIEGIQTTREIPQTTTNATQQQIEKRQGSPKFKFDVETQKVVEIKNTGPSKLKQQLKLQKKKADRIQVDAIAMHILEQALQSQYEPMPTEKKGKKAAKEADEDKVYTHLSQLIVKK